MKTEMDSDILDIFTYRKCEKKRDNFNFFVEKKLKKIDCVVPHDRFSIKH
jgi:hypothetical protein